MYEHLRGPPGAPCRLGGPSSLAVAGGRQQAAEGISNDDGNTKHFISSGPKGPAAPRPPVAAAAAVASAAAAAAVGGFC